MKIVIPESLKREFKKACVDADSNMSEIVCALVQEWLTGRIQLNTESEPILDSESKSNEVLD